MESRLSSRFRPSWWAFTRDVTAYLADYGPNTIWVFKVAPGVGTGRMTAEERNRKPLSLEDAPGDSRSVSGGGGSVRTVFKRIYIFNAPPSITARYKDKEVTGLDYSGGDTEYEDVFNARPYIGRFFTEAENVHRADVAVIGYDLGKDVFPRR